MLEKQERALYWDATQPVEARVNDLLQRMTLDEKLVQLGSYWVFELLSNLALDAAKLDHLLADGIGQITRVAGASSLSPAEGARVANQIQQYLIDNTRLGIPAMVHEECCSGYMARDATCFPQIIGVASTWEPELAQAMASVVREQMRAAGAHQGLSPVIDITRDPRWGRVEETFGEDPYLVTQMGVEFVRGLQGENWQEGVVATAKHFVGYGVPEGGMNWAPSHISPRELRETFLLPFEAAVKEANLQSVMNAYHEIDGVPCAANHELLTEILRDDWGFDGLVVSDYFAVEEIGRTHHMARDDSHAAEQALEAGIDVELPSFKLYADPLRKAIEDGNVDMETVNSAVSRVLSMKFQLGLFDHPFVDETSVTAHFDTPEQRQLARTIAQKSMVLLKNDDNLLPLSKSTSSIAVIGPNANTVRNLLGDYAYPCHIESLIEMRDANNVFDMPVPENVSLSDNFVPIRPILTAIREVVDETSAVGYAEGCHVNDDWTDGIDEAVTLASQSDVAIVVLGGKSGLTDDCTCGEARDRADIDLPGIQQQLLEAVVATGTPVVAVLVNGRPLTVSWMHDHVPAILEAWLPGEEGAEAVADVLFGDVNPGGKLPITFPRHVGQIPTFYNHKPSGGHSHWKDSYVDHSHLPLYPFGYGLSYTTFELRNMRVPTSAVTPDELIQVQVDVVNTGDRDGDEVVQLYIHDELASVTRPLKELKGFKRVHVPAGETRTLTFELPVNQLGYYGRDLTYILESGTIQLMLGTSSDDIQLTDTVEIAVDGNSAEIDKAFTCRVHVA